MYADLLETGSFFCFFAKHFDSSIPSQQRGDNCCEADGGHDLLRINFWEYLRSKHSTNMVEGGYQMRIVITIFCFSACSAED